MRLIKTIKIEPDKKLEEIFPLDELKDLLKNINDDVLYWLGDTVLHLISDNCDIIVEELVRNNITDSYVMLRLNDKFISDLTIGTMSLLQLPMVTQPRAVDSKGAYYPYIKTESTNLYLFVRRVVV